LASANHNEGKNYQIDIFGDVRETCLITDEVSKNTGVIYLGGGTPKNFIQQTAYGMDEEAASSHKYAIQLTQDMPNWGGLSGCTFGEAKSWGKIDSKADEKICIVDVTIGLPMIASALAGVAGLRRAAVPDISAKLDRLLQQNDDPAQRYQQKYPMPPTEAPQTTATSPAPTQQKSSTGSPYLERLRSRGSLPSAVEK
jgi:deoxyhypusine synthase